MEDGSLQELPAQHVGGPHRTHFGPSTPVDSRLQSAAVGGTSSLLGKFSLVRILVPKSTELAIAGIESLIRTHPSIPMMILVSGVFVSCCYRCENRY